MKGVLFTGMVILLCVVLGVSAAYGQDKVMKRITDLRVDAVHSSECLCDLKKAGAIYMNDIIVDVSNHKASAGRGGTAVSSSLVLSYYDMVKGKIVTVTKDLPLMKPFPQKSWMMKDIVMVEKPVLAKTNPGIRVEITITTENVRDTMPRNNVMRVKECKVLIRKEDTEKKEN
ncbi:MAG: hypothetical protein GY765_02130 [bacterium]|nr:hypothetical protein [bacterium]